MARQTDRKMDKCNILWMLKETDSFASFKVPIRADDTKVT